MAKESLLRSADEAFAGIKVIDDALATKVASAAVVAPGPAAAPAPAR